MAKKHQPKVVDKVNAASRDCLSLCHARSKKVTVDYERAVEKLFSSHQVTASKLDSLLLKIGETRAMLRGTHLKAHLEMKKILSQHQVMMYDNLRGYSNGGGSHKHNH